MIEVKIDNRIEEQIEKYQSENGTSKVWIAKKMGITKQSLYGLMKSSNPNLESLAILSYILQCRITDLFDIQCYENDKEKNI